jgi:ubiquinone/menaquinone biosynthesis C-methylase UbiE
VDISPEQVEVAESKAKERGVQNIKWDICDVYHLTELKSRHPQLFDVVHSRFVLTHLEHPEKAIDSMMAVLEPGGVLLMEEMGDQVIYEVSGDNQSAKKAMEGFAKMVNFQAEMQKSHKVSSESVERHLRSRAGNLTIKLVDCVVTGSLVKKTFKMSIEIVIKKLDDMKMPQLIQKFGYQNSEEWIRDIDSLINDDSVKVTVKNVTYVSAIMKS